MVSASLRKRLVTDGRATIAIFSVLLLAQVAALADVVYDAGWRFAHDCAITYSCTSNYQTYRGCRSGRCAGSYGWYTANYFDCQAGAIDWVMAL